MRRSSGSSNEADGEPLNIGRETRSIAPAIARALRVRDGGCRYPGCDRTRFCEGHHVQHWADGGETKLANLVTLCGFHHRLVHEGCYSIATNDDGLSVFTRPDGTRVPDNGERCFRGNNSIDGFQETLRENGLVITAETARCQWHGERMDYSTAIEAMHFLDSKEPRPTWASPACAHP